MKTIRTLTLLATAVAIPGLVVAAESGGLITALLGGGGPPACEASALMARESARNDARASFWETLARCKNDPGGGTFLECVQDAWAEREEALEDLEDIHEARLELCEAFGHGPYAPVVNPATFSTGITNNYHPLPIGQTRFYEKVTPEGLEEVQITTLASTRDIDGVTCAEISEIAWLDGELIEDTLDWFAQDANGDIWYFGEIAKNYDEEGFLVDIDGSWRSETDGAFAGILVLGTPVIGTIRRQEFLIGEAEDVAYVASLTETVTVPFGTFTNCLMTIEGSALEPDSREAKFYAPGTGLVLELDLETGERLLCTLLGVSPEVAARPDDPAKPPFPILARVAEDYAPVAAQLDPLAWMIAALALASAALVGYFASVLSRRVVRPLRELGEVASEVRKGRAAQFPHRGVGDEVDDLGEHLEEAFHRLEDALNRQTRFTSDAAHELRNPISVIQNASEIALRRERDAAGYRGFLEDVRATSTRMGEIVEALLLLAKMDAGTVSASFQQIDLGDVARDSVAAHPSASGRVTVENGQPVAVRGDAALLRVLVDNLVANALRYSPDDTPVTLSVRSGNSASLEVHDRGGGIPPESVGRVFDRFYRAEATNPASPGAGLGLSIVAEVARVHGATLDIDTGADGTTVRVGFA